MSKQTKLSKEKEEILRLESIFEMITALNGKVLLFPLQFIKVSAANKSRKYAIGTIIIPNDIAKNDIRPVTNDWVYLTFAFPKKEYTEYLQQDEEEPK